MHYQETPVITATITELPTQEEGLLPQLDGCDSLSTDHEMKFLAINIFKYINENNFSPSEMLQKYGLVAIVGAPGSGKTTVGKMLTIHATMSDDRVSTEQIDSDDVRTLLRNDREIDHEALYTDAAKKRVYDEMVVEFAKAIVERDREFVVLSSTFKNTRHLDVIKCICDRYRIPFRLLVVTNSDSELVKERMKQRKSDPGNNSQADSFIYHERDEKYFNKLAQEEYTLHIDTAENAEKISTQLIDMIFGRPEVKHTKYIPSFEQVSAD